MKKYFKVLAVFSLLLFVVGCSSLDDTPSQQPIAPQPRPQQPRPQQPRPQQPKPKTETEELADIFRRSEKSYVNTANHFRKQNVTIKNYIGPDKDSFNYKKVILELEDDGATNSEAELYIKSMQIISLLYNEYNEKGIHVESNLEALIRTDENFKNALKNIRTIEARMYLRRNGIRVQSTSSLDMDSKAKKIKQDIETLKKQVAANTARIEEVSKENRQGIALSTAMAQINPLGINEGKFSAGVGMGYFKGETGLAFGVGYGISENISVSSKGAFAVGDFKTFTIGAGVNFQF